MRTGNSSDIDEAAFGGKTARTSRQGRGHMMANGQCGQKVLVAEASRVKRVFLLRRNDAGRTVLMSYHSKLNRHSHRYIFPMDVSLACF